jgi:hypothetical protein
MQAETAPASNAELFPPKNRAIKLESAIPRTIVILMGAKADKIWFRGENVYSFG